nr:MULTISPECIES: PAS domain-containing protein [Halorhodospira]
MTTGQIEADAYLQRLYGYQSDPACPGGVFDAETWRSHIHPQDRAEAEEAIEQAVRHHQPWNQIFRIRRLDGGRRYVRSQGRIELDAEGNAVRLVGTEQDVTERETHQQELEATRQRLEQAERIGRLGHWVTYPRTGRMVWSPMMYELTGFDPEQPPPNWTTLIQRIPETDRFQIAEYQFEADPSLESSQGEYRILHPDGRTLWVREAACQWQDEYGTWIVQTIVQDITEYRQVLDRVEERRQQLEAILQAETSVSLIQTDLHGTICEASRSAELLFGYPREALIGRDVRTLHEPADRAEVAEGIEWLRRTRQEYTREYELIRSDGERFRARVSVAPVLNAQGELIGRLGACMDLSQQSAEQHRLRLAQEAAGFGVWEWDTRADAVTLDATCCRMFGLDPMQQAPLSYEQWRSSVHPDDIAPIEATLERQLTRGHTFTYEFRYRCADGDWLWVQARGQTLRRAADGTPALIAGTYVEVQQLKETEFALRRREQELAEAKRIGRLGHWSYDTRTGAVEWSEEMYELFGAGPPDHGMTFERYRAMIHPKDRPQVEAAIEQSLYAGTPYVIEHRVLCPDGQERTLYARGYTEFDAEGHPRILRGTAQDVTEDRELRRSLAQANETKDAFLRAVSHDLRTPLNALMGFLELLDEPDLPERQRAEYMKHCRQGAERLLRLIDTLLDLTRLQAGQLELRPEVFSLPDLIDGQCTMLEATAREQGLSLTRRIGTSVPEWVEGDATRLGQVLSNLLGNAVKYTPSGSVHLEVSSDETDGRIRFAVQDTGPGLSREQQEQIFQAFHRGDYQGPRTGHGLGLAIVRELVQCLDGSLSLESTPGQGSTFSFTIALPAAERPAAPEGNRGKPATPAPAKSTEHAPRVLVADDEPTNALLARAMLEQLGCSVATAPSGNAALKAWDQETFDLLLLDLHMPDLDGTEVAQAVRADEQQRGLPPATIALCTAYAREDAERMARGITLDAYLNKPVTRQELAGLVRRIAGLAEDRATGRSSPCSR